MLRSLVAAMLAAVLVFAGAGCGNGRIEPATPPKELIPLPPPPMTAGGGKGQPADKGGQQNQPGPAATGF